MSNTFRLIGIDASPFQRLFDLTDDQLKAHNAQRLTATERPGFPCRVSLEDAHEGEEILLLPYEHQPAASPYRASGPIFIRRNARKRELDAGEVPACVTSRLISVRAYDSAHAIVDAGICEGVQVAEEITRQFRGARAAYIHLHNAKRGCFSCKVVRA